MAPATRPTLNRYLIGLGSNRPHHRHGGPVEVINAAKASLAGLGHVTAAAPTVGSAPLGPSLRRYANTVAVLETELAPPALLDRLKQIERSFGRRNGGQRWSSRVLDLDILLWSGGSHGSQALTIPHPRLRERRFVLAPALAVAGDWRDPLTGLSLRQLHARLTRPRPLLKAAPWSGP
ncbi:MAG: 2-amino-4-hydroxy-6-hydroxymethyldihydropteridine diphosphokinase [Erythrobacter sp. 34-65-8]|nr:MAG: 2-amino-4-hydroxy-6-hydroxymethyldihydropteridine diphosphokinase [Erythrobacter sp. 34-65-8]